MIMWYQAVINNDYNDADEMMLESVVQDNVMNDIMNCASFNCERQK